MSPTTTDLREDIRYIAMRDTRHRFLIDAEDGWFDRMALIILTERTDDGEPLVGVMLKHPSPCPVDKTATLQIKYWVANLDRKGDLDAAFKANIAAINTKMAELGAERVWGAVPRNADHLTARLDPIATAAKCVRIDGNAVVGGVNYKRFIFYFGDRDDVNNWIQRVR